MVFLQISKHSAQSCPLHSETFIKINDALVAKTDEIQKKYGIKTVGAWTAMMDHLFVAV